LSVLIACHECDLLQQEVELKPGGVARCRRCRAVLYRDTPHSVDRSLAFTISAAMFFAIATIYPIYSIDMKGSKNSINLYGAVGSLWDQGMPVISAVVAATAIIVPITQLLMLLYLLFPLRLGIIAPGVPMILRVLQAIKPWGMIEVLMLGILVSLVKLTGNFTVVPGIALWSFACLTFLLAALESTFNPHVVWAHIARHHARVAE